MRFQTKPIQLFALSLLLLGASSVFAATASHSSGFCGFCGSVHSSPSYAPGYAPLESIDFVALPGSWGSSTITYSFADTTYSAAAEPDHTGDIVPLESFMPFSLATIKSEIRDAFDAWEEAANLTFVEVADSGTAFSAPGATGDIRIGGQAIDGANGTLAHAFGPPEFDNSGFGDIHFDTGDTWKIGFGGGGFDIFQVAAHEIGHAIGLNHTGVAGSLMNASYSEAFSGPQADDIAGVVSIYGIALQGAAAPEPSSFALLFFGAFMFRSFQGGRRLQFARVLTRVRVRRTRHSF